MIDARTTPYAALLLRLGLGSLFLAHAGMEISTFTPPGTGEALTSAGQPGWLASLSVAWEIFGAFALILGFMPRLVALTMIPVLLGAIVTAHGSDGFFFGNPTGGWEFPALWLLALAAQALIGDGAFALEPTPVIAGWFAPAAQRHRERLRRTRGFAQ
jgi:putative oxidoreductase